MTLQKAKKLDNIRYDIRGPIAAEAARMERQGVPIIKLNTGNPALFGFETPAYILEDLLQNAALSAAYSESAGIDAARQAIVEYSAKKGIGGLTIDDVYTGNGVSEMIMLSLQALLNPGDEVLVPAPDYPLWTAATALAGGVPVHYVCDEKAGWAPDLEDMKRKISPRTRAMVVINPNNPTGAVYPKAYLEQMLALARRHRLAVLADEIYDRLIFDGLPHTACAALAPDLPVLTYNGLSKSHHICGFRCGWLTLSGEAAALRDYRQGLSTLASLRLCSNVLSQTVIPAALQDDGFTRRYIRPGGRLYAQRERAFARLNAMPGLSAVKPGAGLYIFPKIDRRLGIQDDERMVLDFLRQKHVLLTHGRSFNWPAPDHFRLVYLPQMEQLDEVLDRLEDFLAGYSR